MVDAITGWLGVVVLLAAVAVCIVSDVALDRSRGTNPSGGSSPARRLIDASLALLLCVAVAATFARLFVFA